MTVELEQYEDEMFINKSTDKVTALYDMGFPSDLVPYDERAQALDTCISKLRKSEVAQVVIKSNLDQSRVFYCKVG